MNKKIMCWVFGLVVSGIGCFSIIKWCWEQKFSAEVNAAIITALVTVFVSIFSIMVTVGVTMYYNRKNLELSKNYNDKIVEISYLSQRSTTRDKLLEKRYESYQLLFSIVMRLKLCTRDFVDDINPETNQKLKEINEELDVFFDNNFYITSKAIRMVLGLYLISNKYKENKFVNQNRLVENYKKVVSSLEENDELFKLIKDKQKEITHEKILECIEGHDYIFIANNLPVKWSKDQLGINTSNQKQKNMLMTELYAGYLLKTGSEIVIPARKYIERASITSNLLQYFMSEELDIQLVEDDLIELTKEKQMY